MDHFNYDNPQTKRKEKSALLITETYEHEKFSVRESHSEDDINEIKRKLANQSKAINEFENYIGILLNVLKGSSTNDYSDQIKKGLGKVEHLYIENIESKKILIREIRKGEDFNKEIENLKLLIKNRTEEIKSDEIGKLISEKKDLLESVSTISEELDNYSEKNNLLIDVLKCRDNDQELEKVKAEIEAIKNENKDLRNKILSSNKKTSKFSIGKINYDSKGGNIFSCFNKHDEDNFTLNVSKNFYK